MQKKRVAVAAAVAVAVAAAVVGQEWLNWKLINCLNISEYFESPFRTLRVTWLRLKTEIMAHILPES